MPVDFQTVRAGLEAGSLEWEPFYVERAFVELGDSPAEVTDQVMMVVLGKLVARTVTEVQPPHETETPQEIQGPVYRDETNRRTPLAYTFETLMLLRFQRLQDRDPLRRSLIPSAPHLPYGSHQLHTTPLLIEKYFQLQKIPAVEVIVKLNYLTDSLAVVAAGVAEKEN